MDLKRVKPGGNITYTIPRKPYVTTMSEGVTEARIADKLDTLDILMLLWVQRTLDSTHIREGIVCDAVNTNQHKYLNTITYVLGKALQLDKALPDEETRIYMMQKLLEVLPKLLIQTLGKDDLVLTRNFNKTVEGMR